MTATTVKERLPGASERTLRRTVVRPAWVVLALAALPFALGVPVPAWLRYGPLVASVLLLGLPHGAVDHLAVARVAGEPLIPRVAAAVVGVYALLGGAYLAAWFLAPTAAFGFFILLTWFHWGQGDLYLLRALSGGSYPDSRAGAAATLVVRGGLPMLVPLLAFPEHYRAVMTDLVGLFVAGDPGLAWAFAPETRLAAGGAFAVLTLATLALGARSGSAWWRVDAVETLLLWAFFLVVPPVFAVGCYFCVWHAARHVARLVLVDDRAASAVASASVASALGRFARDAAPLTVVSVLLLAGFSLVVPRAASGLAELVALYLVFIAVLTLPHVAVVTWMDRRQGVWAGS